MEPMIRHEVLDRIREDDVGLLLARPSDELDGVDCISVKMHCSPGPILGLRQLYRATVEGDLIPGYRVMLRQSHARVNADDELSKVFRESMLDRLAQPVVLFIAQEANPSGRFL